ncbi:tRNA (guanine(26)-N(2))-dimethyltransferase [Candidatus Woesearchaeota archaeon]|nr:tRNA (guanine(26)-N(2))-dimethyltransferase [Candidatus Woesearchaeota archaeon]
MPKLLNFPMEMIKEGSASISVPVEKKISKKLPVFYNPVMKLNRDMTVLLLQQFPPMNLCDPLAGSGIRSIRFARELKYKSITANDLNERAVALIKKNMKLNKVSFRIYNKDANMMILGSKGFDFIDLDVFGCPNFMLDSSVNRISRGGILAVTATDTSALAGTYPKACLRKYWAVPLRNELMHEIGLRILIRKVQLIGSQYNKALTPIFSYSKEHYMRVFLKCEKSKEKTDIILKQHGFFEGIGPIWKGSLWDRKLVKKMLDSNKTKENDKFLSTINEESGISSIGFYDLHRIAKRYNLHIPKKEELIKKLKKKGYKASNTHFSGKGIRSDISLEKLKKLIRSLYKRD